MGVKPLYLARTPSGLLFASEIKALLQCRELDRSLDARGIDALLHFAWSPSPRTVLRHVEKLEPGMAMRVRRGVHEERWRYWDLPYSAEVEAVEPKKRAAACSSSACDARRPRT